MRSVRSLFERRESLAAEHLPQGVQVPVIIESVRVIHFDDGAVLALRFKGKQRELLARQTNALRIGEQLGDDWSSWAGKMIYIEASECEWEGELVPCVRVVEHPAAVPAARFQF